MIKIPPVKKSTVPLTEAAARLNEFESKLVMFLGADKKSELGDGINPDLMNSFMYSMWRAMRPSVGLTWTEIQDSISRARGEAIPKESLFSLA